jgi:hypothetical protein
MKPALLLTLCLAGLGRPALAQLNPDQLNFGLTAGVGLTNLVFKQDGKKVPDETYAPGPGLRVGGFARYRFNETWGVQPGLELTTVRSTANDGFAKTRTSVVSLAVPLPATYTLPVGDNAVLFNAGPLLRFNLAGRVKSDAFSQQLEFGGANADYRRLSPGLQLGVAYRIPVPRLFRSRASAHGGEDREVDYLITGIDGTLVETVYKSKNPNYTYKENLWSIVLRLFWNFSTNQRDNRGTKR